MEDMIRSFNELTTEQWPLAGGKGSTLAQLYQAGCPVPDGFVILPAAFAGDTLTPQAWTQVQARLGHLRARKGNETAFAVRSSAQGEDAAHASFAGEFETILNVQTDEDIQQAINTVRQSRKSQRAQSYGEARGVGIDHEMAVVVQKMIQPNISGVLFTADPITGSRTHMTANFVYGLGEQLVSGNVNPHTFTLERVKGQYDGPPELKRFARKLYKLAVRLEKELGASQDIEWAIAGRELFLLQSRPITTLHGHNLATGEWNDSLTGDFLWSRGNIAEAVPDVMTPCTWSLIQIWVSSVMALRVSDPMMGNIGGRIYVNLGLLISIYRGLGMNPQSALHAAEDAIGRLPPEGLDVPTLPFNFFTLLPIIVDFIKVLRTRGRDKKKLPEFITAVPKWCAEVNRRIHEVTTERELAAIWHDEIAPYISDAFRIGWASVDDPEVGRLRKDLSKLIEESDVNTLLSNLSGDSELLASLGMAVGLSKVASGEMSRQAYLEQYGHRGAHEAELSMPAPAEDSDWLDQLLAEFVKSPVDVESLLARRRSEFDAAWQRFQDRYPQKAESIRQRIANVGAAARQREIVRSEIVRIFRVVRQFALRVGQLTNLGDDVFFLRLDEISDLLSGDHTATAYIPARRETYLKYKALPSYPAIIRGRFDPFKWAADPHRRNDIFDSRTPMPTTHMDDTITGFAGAVGRVEGVVRCLSHFEEGEQLQPGEILVTILTNVGWTPLFPRAAAIITDVGAPLSHAAIVARELGIPAVVGCGDATMRLQTGDRVLVDGGQGIVKILSST